MRRLVTTLFLLLLPHYAAAEKGETEGIATFGFSEDKVGYLLFDADSGKPLEALNTDGLFIPASVAKVPATLAALSILGPEHRFATRLMATGRIAEGRLTGDLYLVGGGDPLLDNEGLIRLAADLSALGINKVEGEFFYDESLYPAREAIDPAQPLDAGYNPGVSALSLNFNVVEAIWKAEPQSGETLVFAVAASDYSELPAPAVTFVDAPPAADSSVLIRYREFGASDSWLLAPALPNEGRRRLPVKDPARHVAGVFQRLLNASGIEVREPKPAQTPAEAQEIARLESPPLSEVVRQILRFSNNVATELVALATLRKLQPGEGLDIASAAARIAAWLSEEIPEFGQPNLRLANSSGLSSASRMSPAQAGAILRLARLQEPQGVDYEALLSSREGRGFKGPRDMVAKSGTVYYGRAIIGFFTSLSGRRLGFAVFISDLEARAKLDASKLRYDLGPPKGARQWLRRARELERVLINGWAKNY